MPATNYHGVLEGLAALLRGFSGLQGVMVLVEQDPVLGLPDDGGRSVVIMLDKRRPASGQSMSAGKRLRSRLSILIVVVGFDAESYEKASEKRNDLIDQVELAVLSDRTLGNTVANLEIMGGPFMTVRSPGDAPSFAAMAETTLDMDVSAIST